MQIIRKFKQFISINFTFKNIGILFLKIFIVLMIFLVSVPLNILFVLNQYYKDYIYYDAAEVPETRVAIVFGAGLSADANSPSSILEDRVMSAVELYKEGKVQKIIMSGDNRFDDYNEPQVMIDFAKKNGVSSFDLQPDFAGRRTYDTCYRAKYIFGVEKAVLITQDFHLTRALYTCSSLGIDSIGYSADRSLYKNMSIFTYRDIAATLLAFWELNVSPPEVLLGDKINF